MTHPDNDEHDDHAAQFVRGFAIVVGFETAGHASALKRWRLGSTDQDEEYRFRLYGYLVGLNAYRNLTLTLSLTLNLTLALALALALTLISALTHPHPNPNPNLNPSTWSHRYYRPHDHTPHAIRHAPHASRHTPHAIHTYLDRVEVVFRLTVTAKRSGRALRAAVDTRSRTRSIGLVEGIARTNAIEDCGTGVDISRGRIEPVVG